MASNTQGIGLSTTKNILAVLKPIPETTGTYADVAAQAQQYGANTAAATLSRWVTTGRADLRARKNNTAYARFTKRYKELGRVDISL